MKNIKNKFFALLLITSGAFLSCKKGDPIEPKMPITTNTTPTPTNDNPTLTRGDWRIATFTKNGVDESRDYNGYLFTFNMNGTIKVVKNNVTMNGMWLLNQDNGQQKMFISFSDAPLNDLNDTWIVKAQPYTDLKLERMSGANGETDNLTFRRNQQEEVPVTTK